MLDWISPTKLATVAAISVVVWLWADESPSTDIRRSYTEWIDKHDIADRLSSITKDVFPDEPDLNGFSNLALFEIVFQNCPSRLSRPAVEKVESLPISDEARETEKDNQIISVPYRNLNCRYHRKKTKTMPPPNYPNPPSPTVDQPLIVVDDVCHRVQEELASNPPPIAEPRLKSDLNSVLNIVLLPSATRVAIIELLGLIGGIILIGFSWFRVVFAKRKVAPEDVKIVMNGVEEVDCGRLQVQNAPESKTSDDTDVQTTSSNETLRVEDEESPQDISISLASNPSEEVQKITANLMFAKGESLRQFGSPAASMRSSGYARSLMPASFASRSSIRFASDLGTRATRYGAKREREKIRSLAKSARFIPLSKFIEEEESNIPEASEERRESSLSSVVDAVNTAAHFGLVRAMSPTNGDQFSI